MPSPLIRVAKLLASPTGRKAMKRANDEVRKQLADPKNKERLAKAQDQVRKQMADPKNKERLDNLKSKVVEVTKPRPDKPGPTTKK